MAEQSLDGCVSTSMSQDNSGNTEARHRHTTRGLARGDAASAIAILGWARLSLQAQ